MNTNDGLELPLSNAVFEIGDGKVRYQLIFGRISGVAFEGPAAYKGQNPRFNTHFNVVSGRFNSRYSVSGHRPGISAGDIGVAAVAPGNGKNSRSLGGAIGVSLTTGEVYTGTNPDAFSRWIRWGLIASILCGIFSIGALTEGDFAASALGFVLALFCIVKSSAKQRQLNEVIDSLPALARPIWKEYSSRTIASTFAAGVSKEALVNE